MTTLDDLFPSKYLNAADFDSGDEVLTIKHVQIEEMKDKNGKPENKPVLFFFEKPKGLVLNKTNGNAIGVMYGKQVGDWLQKKVTVGKSMVDSFGELKDAVRIRTTPPQGEPEKVDYRAAFIANPTTGTWAAFRNSINAGEMEEKQAFGGLTVREWIKAEPGRTTAQAVEVLERALVF